MAEGKNTVNVDRAEYDAMRDKIAELEEMLLRRLMQMDGGKLDQFLKKVGYGLLLNILVVGDFFQEHSLLCTSICYGE